MEPNPVYFNPDNYIETTTGNKLSRKCIIRGTDQIQLNGKSIIKDACIVRGDLAQIKLGKYVIVEDSVTLKPSYRKSKGYF